jgi:hypothetical protein
MPTWDDGPGPIDTMLRQWCPECQAATLSVPCEFCDGQTQTCANCGHHPGCFGPDDDE